MSYLASAAVKGILTLNIYSASYFLAWKKEGAFCHIFPESPSALASAIFVDAASSDRAITTLIQLIVVSIPFTGLPLSLCIGGLAKAAKENLGYLGCVAGLVMVEIMYVIVLGGLMTACMSDVSGKHFLVL